MLISLFRSAFLALGGASLLVSPLLSQSATPVAVAEVNRSSISPSYRFTGSITVRRQALLSPRIPGLVETADLEAGDRVEAGDIVVELDPTLAEIELGLRESDLSLSQAEQAEAQRLVDEANRLGDSGFPRSDRLARETDLEQSKLAVIRAEAEVQAQEERIQRHHVIAPFPGIIARKLTEIGEWVETGTPVVELVGDRDFRLEVRVPQERIREALQTESVEILLPGLPEAEVFGHVEALGPLVEPGTRTFLVRIVVDDPPSILKPGMSAVAVFRPSSDDSVLLLPRDAIIRTEEGETRVWQIRESGESMTVEATVVELGAPRGKNMIVESGIESGARVVVRGNEALRQGQSVRIVDASDSDTHED
ncbi:efflux RND transporter periplasmic adaptor subunit [Puniceicoccus vermicola]|uniref:Efflux RND transporter periplasmic adaptor subunit n=1 Tax=Puniceicoccus vermicola TaxID=388746 RepID=A0A7X1E4S0_9BACT|nr:efflux RND transporter periplasmic adaptor subunit [Puniceicoccus vermicola]MBC2602359.1 efflux RND transporter periplasmic adaptor subunit [Puniceicoccus vermicola]